MKRKRPAASEPPATTRSVVVVFVLALCILLAGCSNRSSVGIQDSGIGYHDQKMWVEAKGWLAGEYKNCTTLNNELKEATLHCDDDVVGKVFDVRFYGETFVHDQPEMSAFHWTCQKNQGIDPSMTCRDRR
jgi:hypothetical protein